MTLDAMLVQLSKDDGIKFAQHCAKHNLVPSPEVCFAWLYAEMKSRWNLG